MTKRVIAGILDARCEATSAKRSLVTVRINSI